MAFSPKASSGGYGGFSPKGMSATATFDGKARTRTGTSVDVEVTSATIDAVLDEIESCLQRVDVAQGSMVKLVKAELNLLTNLENARDQVHSILKSSKREKVVEIFGGNFIRVSRLRAALNAVKLSSMNSADQRYMHCKDVCCTLEQQLRKEEGFGERMEVVAATKQKELLRKRASVVLDPAQFALVEKTLEEAVVDQKAVDAVIEAAMEDIDIEHTSSDKEALDQLKAEGGSEVWEARMAAKKKAELERMLQAEAAAVEMEDAVLDGDWMTEQLKDMAAEKTEVDNLAAKLFKELDKNGDGKVTKTEMKNAISKNRQIAQQLHIRAFKDVGDVFKAADKNLNGELDLDEFTAWLKHVHEREAQNLPAAPIDEGIARKAFEAMDIDGDGELNLAELRMAYAGILLSLGERVSRKRVARWAAKAMKDCDHDGSKTLDREEFKELFNKSGTLRAAAKMPKVKTIQYAKEDDAPAPTPAVAEGSRVQVTSGKYQGKFGSVQKVRAEDKTISYRVMLDGAAKPTWVDHVRAA